MAPVNILIPSSADPRSSVVGENDKSYQLHEAGTEPRPPVEERRQEARFSCGRQRFVRVLARPSLQCFNAAIKDFSMKGLGIIVDQPMEPGTIIALQLRSAQSGLSGLLSGLVCRSMPCDDGRWVVGCSLSKRLTDSEALALL